MKREFTYIDVALHKIPKYWASIKPDNDIGHDAEEAWKAKVEFLDHLSAQNNVVVFLLNPYTNRFLYMSDKLKVLSGLDPALYTAEDGMEFSLSRIHPEHLEACLKFNQLGFSFFSAKPNEAHKNSVMSLNYLYKGGNNAYAQVLQQAVVLEVDEHGHPALFINYIHYVGHIKKHDSVGFASTTPNGINIYSYDPVQKCIEPAKTFSDHEKRIIALLAEGYDTKHIAEKLFISPHTVDTHRRNLIKKTDCMDTTAVVDFARLINLI